MNSGFKRIGFAILPFFISLINAEEAYLLRFNNPDQALVTRFLKEGRDIASYIPGDHIDIVASESDYRSLSANHRSIAVLETSSQIHAKLLGCRGYHSYEHVLDTLRAYEKKYPQICKLYDIGDSRGKEYAGATYNNYKHDIWAMKVTGNIAQAADKPKFYYVGEHHAREPASTEVCMAVLGNFLFKYNTDASITDRVNNCEIWFVPLLNPNGHKAAFIDQDHSMWRKNIRDNDNDGKITLDMPQMGYGDGVDLNRNYDYLWGKTGTDKLHPTVEVYCGPTPGSEPEIKAMKALTSDNMFVAGLSYHLYSELVLWPYDCMAKTHAPDSAALGHLGRKLASKMPKVKGGAYKPQKGSSLYENSGTMNDYVYSAYGTFAYTIEMFDASFWPNDAQVETLKKNHVVAALELVNRVTYSTLTGTVTSGTKSPVEAVVYVKEIDDTIANKTAWRGPYMTEKTYGRYYRLLMPGTYTVTFRPKNPAFKDTTVTGVTITSDKVTTLHIAYGGTPVLSMNGFAPDRSGIYMEKTPGGIVRIALPAGDEIRGISVFTAGGAFVREVPLSSAIARNIARWDARGMGRGLYLVRVRGANREGTARLVVTE